MNRRTVRDDLWGVGHPAFAQAAVAGLTQRLESTALTEYTFPDLLDLVILETARYVRDRDYSGLGAAESLRASLGRIPRSGALALESYALLFEAWSAVRRGGADVEDLVQRIGGIDRLGPTGGSSLNLYLPMAYLLDEYGDPGEALSWLDRRPDGVPPFYSPEIWALSGRLAEAAGDRDRAIREYRRYVKMRAFAGPELIPELERIRAELARLEAG